MEIDHCAAAHIPVKVLVSNCSFFNPIVGSIGIINYTVFDWNSQFQITVQQPTFQSKFWCPIAVSSILCYVAKQAE